MIKGIPILLYEITKIGEDGFGAPIYEEIPTIIDNVLVSPSTTDDIISSTNLFGKKAVYTLAIPKGDDHEWEDKRIEFFGAQWRTFGFSVIGIEELIPLLWNQKVMVERYE